ncbi:MAG TPA: hypothetical protein VMF32_06210 [Xanthobacteraceae bacterium]|nr:hypothetical protein [Xanthobacteraceae bacterium]
MAEVEPLLAQVRSAADQTAQAIRCLVDAEPDGIEVLRRMKFTEMARHPLADRPLNLVEQINQTWTCLVSLKALPFLFERHPEAGGFRLNLGAAAGTDIESVTPGAVAAETFAAVNPSNNRKLVKDLQKLARECPDARARYVFFASPKYRHERQHKLECVDGIEVWGIDV